MGKQHLAEQHQLPYTYDDIEDDITSKFCKELVIGIDAMWKELVEKFNFLLGEVDNAFGIIAVSGETNVVADTPHDTVTLIEGNDIVITTNGTTSTITFAVPAEPTHTHDARYFRENEHINSSAGAGDAGKPIKLDVDGNIDATMINDADIDHGSIGGLDDDDHTHYALVDGTRDFTGNVALVKDDPILTLRDSGGTGIDALAYIRFLYGVATQMGYIGMGSAGNNDIYLYPDNGGIKLYAYGSPQLNIQNNSISGIVIKDEDDMASESASHLCTQQSIKAYVDNVSWQGNIDHGSIGGLTDDDHIMYARVDGTRNFTGIQTFESAVYVENNTLRIRAAAPRLRLHETDAEDPNDYYEIGGFGSDFVLRHWDNSLSLWDNILRIQGVGAIEVANSAIVLDEDNMASDSAVKLATQQSIKAYADALIAALPDTYYTETEVDTWRNSVTQTEMGYLHGVTSDIQTQIDALGSGGPADSLPGIVIRPQFAYKDSDEIYIGGGVYHHEGTAEQLVFWDSQLTFQIGSGGTNGDSDDAGTSQWHYLYIDDSAVVTLGDNELTATEFLNSTTAPSWSEAKKGWYNGSDRCIFAFYVNSSGNIDIFYHYGDERVWWDTYTSMWDGYPGTSWTTQVTFRVPAYCYRAFGAVWSTTAGVSTSASHSWRRGDSSSSNGFWHGYSLWDGANDFERNIHQFDVILDDNYQIDIKVSAANSNNRHSWYQWGYYFGKGM